MKILLQFSILLNIAGIFGEPLSMTPIRITVSSLYREPIQRVTLIDREIQIHWDPDIEKILVYRDDPATYAEPVLEFKTINYPEGYFQTNISLGNPKLPGGWDIEAVEFPEEGDHCLPVWAAGYIQNKLSYMECLKIHPTWMQDSRLSIGNLAVSSLFIPGTHNSGCYKRGETLSQKDISGRYILTQDQDLWSQLVYGVRYFDFRVGYYPVRKNGTEVFDSDNSFTINHDLIKVRPLVPLLQQLKEFLYRAKGEIVILDLHRFPVGFSSRRNRHERLVALLERELKELAIPFTENPPALEKIWDQGKRIIISYGESSISKENPWLWPPIKQLWGNQQTPEGLHNFLEACMNRSYSDVSEKKIWAAMAHLTPAPLDILFNPTGSLRTLANSINKNVTQWFKTQWWQSANIIASDFFLENDLINIAIAANVERGNKSKQYALL